MRRVHILGVCGKLMSGIALLAKKTGCMVTGYDQKFLMPMSGQLIEHGIECVKAWDTDYLRPDDVLIVGNGILSDNPIIHKARKLNMRMLSGPQWLQENILADRQVIAITGTHGKTTLSSWCVQIFNELGIDVGYLIGGITEKSMPSASFGHANNNWFVIEADEYDSAFFDKRPKFLHYWPKWVLVNNIEHDHVDIFSDLEAMQKQYQFLMRTVHPDGGVVASSGAASALGTKVTTFGVGQAADYEGRYIDGELVCQDVKLGEMWGAHTAHNCLGLFALFSQMGFSLPKGIFQRLKLPVRRMEYKGDIDGTKWFDDFAHHPTAILANYQALAARYKNVALIIHPATYTQRRREGYRELFSTLKGIKQVAILPDAKQHALYDLPGGWVYVESAQRAQAWAQYQSADAVCVMSSQYLPQIFAFETLEYAG